MWTQQALSNVRGPSAGIGDRVSFGGGGVLGFALGAPGDPDVFGSLTADQQKWVIDTLVRLNDLITKSTGTSCPTFGPSVPAAAGCFQVWFNAAFAGQPVTKLRTDGVFDRDTLNALITTTQIHASDFPTPFPGDAGGVTSASLVGGGKKLSDGAKIAIGVGGALALGGILYATTRGGGRKSRKGRR